jgi:hypothetical protein
MALVASALVCLPILSVLRLAPQNSKTRAHTLKQFDRHAPRQPRPSGGFNFRASLHQERFTKWSRIDSSGSHKNLSAAWIAERICDSYYNSLEDCR